MWQGGKPLPNYFPGREEHFQKEDSQEAWSSKWGDIIEVTTFDLSLRYAVDVHSEQNTHMDTMTQAVYLHIQY